MMAFKNEDENKRKKGRGNFRNRKPLTPNDNLVIFSLQFSLKEFFKGDPETRAKAYGNIMDIAREIDKQHPKVAFQTIDCLKTVWASLSLTVDELRYTNQHIKEIAGKIEGMQESQAKTELKQKMENAFYNELAPFRNAVQAKNKDTLMSYITNHTDFEIPAAEIFLKRLECEVFVDILPDPKIKEQTAIFGASALSMAEVGKKPDYKKIYNVLIEVEKNQHPHLTTIVKVFSNTIPLDVERIWSVVEKNRQFNFYQKATMTIAEVYNQSYGREVRFSDLCKELQNLMKNQKEQ